MLATKPLGENLRKTILPDGHTAADLKRLTNHFRMEPDGRLLFGGRGGLGGGDKVSDYASLKAKLRTYFPQIADIGIDYYWSGYVALTMDHVPHVHRLAPGLTAALGCNGRGVGMTTAAGQIVAKLVGGMDASASPLPITDVPHIPFHSLRRPGMEAAVWWKGLRDWAERAGV